MTLKSAGGVIPLSFSARRSFCLSVRKKPAAASDLSFMSGTYSRSIVARSGDRCFITTERRDAGGAVPCAGRVRRDLTMCVRVCAASVCVDLFWVPSALSGPKIHFGTQKYTIKLAQRMAEEKNHNTALSLFNATGILEDWVTNTKDATVCSVCAAPFGDEPTYLICRFPEPPEGTRNPPKEHEGHTACKKCALSEDRVYIGEGGACGPCLRALGGRRSHIKLAGIALAQPSKNSLANKMLGAFNTAKQSINAAREEEDLARRQEGADRRAAAVEEIRRRRQEAADAQQRKEVAEAAAKEAAVQQALAEEAARAAAQEKARAEEEAAAARLLRAQEEVEAKRVAAEEAAAKKAASDEDIRKSMELARREAKRLHDEALAKKNEMEAAAARAPKPPPQQTPPTDRHSNGRKKRVMTEESRASFAEKRAEAAAAKRQKLVNYDALLKEKEMLQRQLAAVRLAVDTHLAEHTLLTEDERLAVEAAMDEAAINAEDEEEEEEILMVD